MGIFGKILGTALGSIGSQLLPVKGIDGGQVGGLLGGLAPFKTGGRVGGKKGKAVPILAHGGEYVLPVGVAPTATQRKAVAKRKAAAKKRK